MKCYKILNRDMESFDGCRWDLGEWKESDELGEFCEPGGFHGYVHPLLAVLHNPIYTKILDPRLFEAEADGDITHNRQMEIKAQRMRLIREIPVPPVSIEQRVAYGIYCAKSVYYEPGWNEWADAWLSGADRSRQAAAAAAELATRTAKELWAEGTHDAAAWAAEAAVEAAEAAVERVVDESWAVPEELRVALVAWAGVKAALAALDAARAGGVDFIACAERAVGKDAG